MANHNAHTYFGLQVLGQLPPDLRELCTEDLPVFHLGLYGPDPLIFSLWTKKISDRLHKRWRKESLPDLDRCHSDGKPHSPQLCCRLYPAPHAGRHGSPGDLWLDGGGLLPFPAGDRFGFASPGRKAPGQFPQAAHRGKGAHRGHGGICAQAMGARQYLAGLWRMAALSNCFCGPGRPATGGIRAREKVQARELRDRMEAQICPGGPGVGAEFWYGRQVDIGQEKPRRFWRTNQNRRDFFRGRGEPSH
ncbi:MAG: hypothetical protein ACLSCQ_01795 [Evtepia gabavorous]